MRGKGHYSENKQIYPAANVLTTKLIKWTFTNRQGGRSAMSPLHAPIRPGQHILRKNESGSNLFLAAWPMSFNIMEVLPSPNSVQSPLST